MGGVCGFTCTTGYHACSGQCLSNTDDPSTDPCIASDTFGVFVMAGATGTGTQASPLGSIGAAMALAQSSGKDRVFVCAQGTFATALSVASNASGVTVYGGFTACPTTGTWTYTAGTRSVVAPTAAGYALKVDTSSAQFYDMEFDAKDGVNPGDSSIAGFVTNAPSASFTRCALKAGAGKPGIDAQPIANYSGPSTTGNPGSLTNGGGIASVVCSTGTTVGGAGGAPGVAGNDGTAGTPAILPVDPANATGAPGKASAASCASGSTGSNGTYGPGGAAGLGAASLGSLTPTGWSSGNGAAGGNAGVGQGGGGGASLDLTGGGGGGGAGGCGGSGGAAGTGGGSSIALLVYDSPSVTVTSSSLTAAAAGRGGNGGTGQIGQLAGNPGAAANTAECNGGAGGAGGSGGGGGGGAGGVSAAIAWAGTAAPTTSTITTSLPASGALAVGGLKGSGGPAARTTAPASNAGQDGTPGTAGVIQAIVNLP